MGTSAGYRAHIGWDIATCSQDAQVALSLLAKNPPWRKGSLLVADATDPGWSQYAELAPPDRGDPDKDHGPISCWHRLGVVGASVQFGILGVDAWKAGAISTPSDENIVESFATLLAAGFIAQAGVGKAIADEVVARTRIDEKSESTPVSDLA